MSWDYGLRRTMGAHVSGFRDGRRPGPWGEESLHSTLNNSHLPSWDRRSVAVQPSTRRATSHVDIILSSTQYQPSPASAALGIRNSMTNLALAAAVAGTY